MRRWIVWLALPLAAVLVLAYPGVWSRALALAQGTPQSSVYFGFLQGTPRIGGVAIDLTAPGGTHWFGRSGNVREGQPGRTIIGLDKKPRR